MNQSIHAYIFLLVLFAPPIPTGFKRQVVSVKDGDTIEILHNRKVERIRLSGLDHPERITLTVH